MGKKRNTRPPARFGFQQPSAVRPRRVARQPDLSRLRPEPAGGLAEFAEVDWNFLVDFWAAYNRFLAHVIGHLPEEAAKITCNIGNNAPATLGWIAEDYVAHLKHHLNQVLDQTFETSYGH